MNQLRFLWQTRYEAAVLETDSERLPALIEAARAAIDARIRELQADSGGTTSEKQLISDALNALRVLDRERGQTY